MHEPAPIHKVARDTTLLGIRNETAFALAVDEGNPLTDGEEYAFEFEMLDADDEPVTVTHTARGQAE